jgi:glutamate-1-semialdehyde 2,1-aminomutase
MAPGAVEPLTQAKDEQQVTAKSPASSDAVMTAVGAARARFVERNPRSEALHELAVQSLPGGNTRTALFTAPFPLCMKSGKTYQVTSEDDHT